MWMIQCSLLVLLTWVTVIQGRCSISMKDGLPKIEPLILRPGVPPVFRYPTKTGTLEFSTNEQVRLVCNGAGNHFVNLGNNPVQSDVIAVCESNGQFKVAGVSKVFKQLECKNWPATEQKPAGTCFGSYLKYEIGFRVNAEYITLIDVCHDPIKIVTDHSKFKLAKEISGGRPGQNRPTFGECPDHTLCYNDKYQRSAQIATFTEILGSVDEAKKYIKNDGINYLARGHLAANVDFIYEFQKRATFYYINQAPQWQRCNAPNWYRLEKDVRTFASAFDQDLTVYTGVHGLAQLPDITGVQRDLYLNYVSPGPSSIPVPRFFWKVIYNEQTQLGTAFVQVNNQYVNFNPIPTDYKICGNFLENTRWDTWTSKTSACPAYVCKVEELRKFVSFPQFTVRGPLV